jgi:Leu/Phe-tRNA-protein transferase
MADVFERKIWKVFLGATPRSLHGGAERIVRIGLKSMNDFKMTFAGVAGSLRMAEQPRVSLLRSAPAAHQVVANYTRGYLLFGLFGSSPAFWLPRLMWYSYPARSIITPESAKIPRDVRRTQRRTDLEVKFNEDFEEIVHACLEGRDLWVWLTPELIEVYREVHRLGFAATVGVYRDGKLVYSGS